jgi:hypothetical protein
MKNLRAPRPLVKIREGKTQDNAVGVFATFWEISWSGNAFSQSVSGIFNPKIVKILVDQPHHWTYLSNRIITSIEGNKFIEEWNKLTDRIGWFAQNV